MCNSYQLWHPIRMMWKCFDEIFKKYKINCIFFFKLCNLNFFQIQNNVSFVSKQIHYWPFRFKKCLINIFKYIHFWFRLVNGNICLAKTSGIMSYKLSSRFYVFKNYLIKSKFFQIFKYFSTFVGLWPCGGRGLLLTSLSVFRI